MYMCFYEVKKSWWINQEVKLESLKLESFRLIEKSPAKLKFFSELEKFCWRWNVLVDVEFLLCYEFWTFWLGLKTIFSKI